MEITSIILAILSVLILGILIYSYAPEFQQTLKDLNKETMRQLRKQRYENHKKDEEERANRLPFI